MLSGPRKAATAEILALAGAASAALGGCCNDVTTTQCLDWSDSTTCPTPEVAASSFGVGVGQVPGAGTFWPAHDYLIEGQPVHEPATCCYPVESQVCTTELH